MKNKFTLRFIVICLTYYISLCCIPLCSNAKYVKRHGSIQRNSHKMSSYNDNDADQMLNDAPTSNGYSLLRNDIVRQHLHVWRGHSAPLLHEHLPILPRAQKGQVCRVEVEEFQPLLSMVGHLEPKKFECSFANGDVIYRHEGNPLINHDHIQVTIFFFRNNNSVVQTVDIMIDIHDPPKYIPLNTTSTIMSSDASEMNVTLEMKNNKQMQTNYDYSMSKIPESRIQVIRELKVKNLRATSESITSEILKIRYDMNTEECRLSYVSPDYLLSRGKLTNKSDWSVLTSFGGTLTPKLGLPLTAGSAVGGVRRWPLFGQIVHFNRTMVDYIDRDCHEALLQGYRYLHRKGNSYEIDYIPIQITIWTRMNDGSKSQLITENTFLKVKISNAQKLKPPILRTFRQVNVTHIGGSLSVLPKDSISIPRDSIPGWDYLDINMTKMQGPLQAQIVNLRDPTRPVTSFRLTDLRQGLIALQLLNYAESLVKVFVITMTAVDPYFQISQPVNLRIATFLQPVVDVNLMTSNAPPSFQVFSLPLFSYTGAISVIQKHNIQVVGYIDESMIVYTIQQWPNNDSLDDKDDTPQSVRKSHGQLMLDGQPVYGVNFGPPHISTMSLAYMHNGDYEPTVERIPLSITVPNLMNSARRFKRDHLLNNNNNITNDKEYFEGRRNNPRRSRNRHGGQRQHSLLMNKHGKQRKNKRAVDNSSPIVQLELSIRIVRLYNHITNGALKSGGTFRLPTLTSLCFTAEDFLTPEALKAARSDLINLAFVVKVAPSQGVLLRLPIVKNFTTLHHLHTKRVSGGGGDNNGQVNRKYFDDINSEDNENVDIQQQEELIDKSQVGVILLSDLEAGEICYLNRRYDRATDLMGIKQIGRGDFPTVYMTFELQPPLPILINERMDPNVILRVRETASYVPVTPLHLNYGIDLDIQSLDYEQYNRSIFDNFGPEHIVYTILQAPRLRRLEDLTSGDKQQEEQQKEKKYPFIGTHDAGRLVSLSSVTSSTHVGDMKLQAGLAVNLREAHTPCVTQFTQRQIDENDIVYVPPTQDIGYTDQDLIVRYAVSGPGGYELNNREMRIQLVAEDNQIPVVKVISPLTVHRDGELRIDSSVLLIEDLDTPEDKLFLEFKRLPKYGKIILKQPPTVQYDQRNKNSNPQQQQQQQQQGQKQQQQQQKSQKIPVVKNQNLSFSLYNSGRIIYQQSGDNVKHDDFLLTVTDGVQTSAPLQVSIEIKPRVLQESKGHQYVNNTILVKENTSVILTPSVFPSDITDASMITSGMSSAPQYFVIVFPTKGNLLLNNKTKVSQFTYKDILEHRLTYRHGPAEIGVKVNYDFVRIWDFSAGQTFSLNFTLIPVNSQPPVLKSETLLQVKEGDKVEITPYALYASDPDTNEADIQLHVIHPPKWGHIEFIKKVDESNHQYNTSNKEDSMSNEFDDTYSLDFDRAIDEKLTKNNNNNHNNILSFNMQNIRDGLIYYINSIHDNGQECIEDIFSIKAFDGQHYSPKTIEIKIAIQPTNDEIPTVRLLKYFSVPINTKKVLTPYLFSVSDRDVPRDMLQIRFTELPMYGSLSVYWQHGEKYTITQYSNPITQSYLGMLNLLYLQNASLIKNARNDQPTSSSIITMDQFTVTVSDGKHTVERQAHVLIRPENRYPPEMYIDRKTDNGIRDDDGIILDGQKWSRLDLVPGGLVIRDMDTSEDDLILTLLESPKYGVIQRLPRMLSSDGIVDPLDLIEEAWDIEEMKVGGDLQALAQLSVAGSIGGPKTIKILHRGDQFTKRQISTGRIHYLYTGSYQEQYITDSCVLRLSDGQFTTNPITLRFRIRRVNGLNTGLGQSSLPYLPVGHIQHLRPLEYPELKSENIERNEREGNQMHQNDASEMEVELINSIILTTTLNSFTFLQYKDLQLDKIRTNQIKIILQSNLSTPSSCGLLARTSSPLTSIQEFTDNDVRNHRIVFYASNDCEKFLDKHFPTDFKLISPSEDYLGQISITMSITKMKRALPELEHYSEITVLPYTDTIIRSDHLSFKDKDTNLNNIIYVISDESTRQFKLDGQLINVFNESLACFTQSQINLQQILFSSYSAGDSNYAIDLHIFDAGDIGQIDNLNQLCNDILQTVNRSDKQNMASPFLERMKYTTTSSSSSSSSMVKEKQTIVTTSEPIRLKIKNRIFQNVHQNTDLLINQPPKPDSIETVLPGHVGFYLTAENIYHYTLNPSTKFHLLNNEQMKCKLLNKMQNHSIDEYFYQDDLNRRRLVVILLANQKKLKQSHKRQSKLSSIDTVCQIHYEIEDNQSLNNHKKRFSMELSWTKVGFDRKVYTICPERGLLTLSVIRKGINETIQSTVTDVYVGLSSNTAIEGKDFSLHSQKLLVFQKGESKKEVLIRFHPRENSFSRQPLRFYIDLKLPTGGILDKKRRAEVVVQGIHGKCQSKSYFTPVKIGEYTMKTSNNPVKRDLSDFIYTNTNEPHHLQMDKPMYLSDAQIPNNNNNDNDNFIKDYNQQSNDEQDYKMEKNRNDADNYPVKKPISLTEWLATNDLPDSKALSASYEKYMHSNKHSIHCLDGWKYYQHRCYRLYEHQEMTWEEARNYCELQDGFLTSISDEANMKWLTETFKLRNAFWIGLHQTRPHGTWIWHNLEHVSYTKWDIGYPVKPKWRLSTDNRIKRKYRHKRQLHQLQKHQHQRYQRGPKACVLVTANLNWQNRLCNRLIMGVNFICMKNPEVF